MMRRLLVSGCSRFTTIRLPWKGCQRISYDFAQGFSTVRSDHPETSFQPHPSTKALLDGLRSSSFPTNNAQRETKEEIMRRRMALARAITLIESKAPAHQRQADWLLTHLLAETSTTRHCNSSFRVGIAGPPGAGKSTFLETFGTFLLNQSNDDNKQNIPRKMLPSKLAVVCIDPSSTVTGGSILGDKTRMMELSRHHRAFVRPSANGGTFGGLSAYTDDVVSLCRAADYELVFVESVGLGQSEIEIAQSVDLLLLMVPPGGGDELQGVKKGIVEVADMIVVNKADGHLLPAARSTAADYRGAMHYLRPRTEGWKTPVILSSAHSGEGISKIWDKICEFRTLLEETGALEAKRRQQGRYWMWKHLKDLISQQTRKDTELKTTAEAMEKGLEEGTVTPRVAALNLMESLLHPNVRENV